MLQDTLINNITLHCSIANATYISTNRHEQTLYAYLYIYKFVSNGLNIQSNMLIFVIFWSFIDQPLLDSGSACSPCLPMKNERVMLHHSVWTCTVTASDLWRPVQRIVFWFQGSKHNLFCIWRQLLL